MGVSESGEQLQRLIDVAHFYCQRWRLKANVSKSAVMTLGKGVVEGNKKWGCHKNTSTLQARILCVYVGPSNFCPSLHFSPESVISLQSHHPRFASTIRGFLCGAWIHSLHNKILGWSNPKFAHNLHTKYTFFDFEGPIVYFL